MKWVPASVSCLMLLPALLLAPPSHAAEAGSLWLEGPAQHPDDQARHFRVLLDIRLEDHAQLAGMRNLPATHVLDLAAILADAGFPHDPASGALRGFTLDMDSFILVEDASAGPRRVPVQVLPGSVEDNVAFEPSRPTVTLRWVVDGELPPGAVRHYHVYFDSLQNGKKEPLSGDVGSLASAVGPGRGTSLFVPLQPFPGAQQGNEQRSIRITSLYGPANVQVHEYSQISNRPEIKFKSFDFTAAGQVQEYVLGDNGNQASRGLLMVRSDTPVQVEVLYRGQSSTQFLPARDGGYVGDAFIHVPAASQTWAVFCPGIHLPAGESQCRVTVTGTASSITVPANNLRLVTVPAGVVQVQATVGKVAVQRTGQGFAAWPALDGAASGGFFMGYANRADDFLLSSQGSDARASVRSLIPPNPLLSGNMLVTKSLPLAKWNQQWPTGNQHGTPENGVGGILIQRTSGPALAAHSGVMTDPLKHSVVSPLQSPDGGLTYRLSIPTDDTRTDPAGGPAGLGSLLLFAPYSATSIKAERVSPSGQTTVSSVLLNKNEVMEQQGAGAWKITADRPVLVVWRHAAVQSAFSAYSTGITDVVNVVEGAARFWGPVIDASISGGAIKLARPGDQVVFTIQVENLRSDVDGTPLPDGAQITLSAPDGWDTARAVPSFLELTAEGAGRVGTTTVTARVPANVDATTGGATMFLTVASHENPQYKLTLALRVNFVINRAVEVTADGEHIVIDRDIHAGEGVTYDVRVTNRGSVADVFRIEHSPPSGQWELHVTCLTACTADDPSRTAVLQVGESAYYVVDVRSTSSGSTSRLVTTFLAKSTSDLSVTDSVRMVTSVGVDRSFRVEVEEPTRRVDPGSTTTYVVKIINEADANEEINVGIGGSLPAGWSAPLVTIAGVGELGDAGSVVSIPARGTAELQVRRDVPSTAPPGTLALDWLNLRSTFSPKSIGADVALRTIVASTGGISISVAPESVTTSPGANVAVTLRIEALGNQEQMLRVSPRALLGGAWTVHDDAGSTPPWNITVVPGTPVSLPLRINTPMGLPPSVAFVPAMALHVSGPGQPEEVAEVRMRVVEAPSIKVETDPSADLTPGRWTTIPLRISNDGNVQLDVHARWEGLPAGWSAESPDITLPAGDVADFYVAIKVPQEAPPSDVTAALILENGAGITLLEAPWSLRVGLPDLVMTLQGTRSLGPDRAVYQVLIDNQGGASAHRVWVTLTGDEEVIDQVLLAQVLPQRQHVANLIGPMQAQNLRVTVTADHDSVGQAMALEAPVASDSSIPLPALPWLLVAMALAARRWRACL